MKTKITLLFLLMSAFCFGQPSVFEEWNKYLSDCNELVPDTLKQGGKVNCKLIPVKMDGKTISYAQIPVDTVWNNVECAKYKYDNYSGNLVLSNNNLTSNWGVITTSTGTLSSIGYSDESDATSKFLITRNKICNILKRKASWDDFWERWCKEKGLIKFN